MSFPLLRMRRLRKREAIRSMVREAHLKRADLIYPLFVCPGSGVKNEIGAMPGCYQMSVDMVVEECKEVAGLGLPAVILFGIPEEKDEEGSHAWKEDGVVQQAISAIKEAVPELVVITDVCLCEYTSHGHCGILGQKEAEDPRDVQVQNDPTLQNLAKAAVSHAKAGADMVAPSDMMDGRVGVIRNALDQNGFTDVPIMSYAVKYASSFYGPFREAAECAPQFGDRRTYQMDPGNAREALREAALDAQEGADILMVKPGMPYLDVIRILRDNFSMPIAAYQVSGEYSMIKAAGKLGWMDSERVALESLLCLKRAGADLILTYFAKEVAPLLP